MQDPDQESKETEQTFPLWRNIRQFLRETEVRIENQSLISESMSWWGVCEGDDGGDIIDRIVTG